MVALVDQLDPGARGCGPAPSSTSSGRRAPPRGRAGRGRRRARSRVPEVARHPPALQPRPQVVGDVDRARREASASVAALRSPGKRRPSAIRRSHATGSDWGGAIRATAEVAVGSGQRAAEELDDRGEREALVGLSRRRTGRSRPGRRSPGPGRPRPSRRGGRAAPSGSCAPRAAAWITVPYVTRPIETSTTVGWCRARQGEAERVRPQQRRRRRRGDDPRGRGRYEQAHEPAPGDPLREPAQPAGRKAVADDHEAGTAPADRRPRGRAPRPGRHSRRRRRRPSATARRPGRRARPGRGLQIGEGREPAHPLRAVGRRAP